MLLRIVGMVMGAVVFGVIGAVIGYFVGQYAPGGLAALGEPGSPIRDAESEHYAMILGLIGAVVGAVLGAIVKNPVVEKDTT